MKTRILFLISLWVATSITWASDVSSLVANLDSTDFEARQSARLELRQTLVDAGFWQRRGMEKELLKVVGPAQSFATRDWAIRMLELVGNSGSVKTLTSLLHDENPHIRDDARRALMAIPSSSATKALERALSAAKPEEEAGFIDALAYRGEARSVRVLTAVLLNGPPKSASRAALALGKIRGSSAVSALIKKYPSATGVLKRDIELALIDAGLQDKDLAQTLAMSGQTGSIRVAAFERLTALDPPAAQVVLDEVLAKSDFPKRKVMIRKAVSSKIQGDLMARLSSLAEEEQAIVLGAMADQRLSQYESIVLALLPNASVANQPLVVQTLGQIGSDASYQPLFELFLAGGRDREVAAALARLNAPSADAKLLSVAQGPQSIADRISALRLLVLRNTEGVTTLLNGFSELGNEPELRKAAFKGLEVVGNTESLNKLLGYVVEGDPLTFQAQGSLKKLSVSIGVPDYLWTESYEPVLRRAANDEVRGKVIEILDGISGERAAAYLQDLVMTQSPLRTDALKVLSRWTDLSAGEVWLAIEAAPTASDADRAMALSALKRLFSSDRITGDDRARVDLGVKAIQQISTVDFKRAILSSFKGKNPWTTSQQIGMSFPVLLSDPDIAVQVQALIEANILE